MPDNSRFFIVGSGRSGSTLLRLLLMAHSRIHIPPETWFIIPLVERLPLHQPLSTAQVQEAVEIITNDYRWPDMGISAADLKSWATALQMPRLHDIIDLVYADLLRSSGKVRLGDKTPPYISIVPELASLYPDAKFIHLIRDGRDVAISFIDVDYPAGYYSGERFEWTRAVRKGFAYEASSLSARILDLRYEDLVRSPEATLRKVCAFIGEPFEAGMLHGQRAVNVAVPERERRAHPKLALPISEDASCVWRHKLSGLECFLMESCMHKDLRRLGYTLHFGGKVWKPLLWAAGLGLGRAAPFLNRLIPALRRRNYIPRHLYI